MGNVLEFLEKVWKSFELSLKRDCIPGETPVEIACETSAKAPGKLCGVFSRGVTVEILG